MARIVGVITQTEKYLLLALSSSYQPGKFAKAHIPWVWKNQPGWCVEILANPLLSKTIFIMKIWYIHIIYIYIHIYICYLSSASACKMFTTTHLKHVFSIVWSYLEWVTPKTSRQHKERWNCFRAHILGGRVFVRCVSVFHSDSPSHHVMWRNSTSS